MSNRSPVRSRVRPVQRVVFDMVAVMCASMLRGSQQDSSMASDDQCGIRCRSHIDTSRRGAYD